jgi:acyl carrier protein
MTGTSASSGVPLYVAEGVRVVLEQQFSVDMSRLAEGDDFSKNLGFLWDFDSMADVEIVCALEEKFGIKISDREAQDCHTISDIVNLVSSKVGAQSMV